MNMSSLMDRLLRTYLLIFSCFTFVCIDGRDQDLFPSCEVTLMVHRGTTLKTAPRQPLTVKCPVKHCGESLDVAWCKLLNTNRCEQINETGNVEILQDEMISSLIFKRISIYDDGLYRCYLKGSKYVAVSHIINISVSDLHHGVKKSDINADELPSAADGEEESWLPYFYICVSITLLVVILTVITHLSFYGWKRILTFNHAEGQEISTHVIPNLPKGNAPFSPVLKTHFSILDDIYYPSTARRPLPQPPLMNNGNQPAVADKSQTSDHAVYAIINHQQSRV
ncbi:B- and T-lymphocyte attenuator isoform X1 [Micropterus salmoides]|nr:B- and T-lymphocyte attenuator isoform X1 [Micropterus salmoides]